MVTPSSGISVHLVAHSHDDVGWLKTVDQYYQVFPRHPHHGPTPLSHLLAFIWKWN